MTRHLLSASAFGLALCTLLASPAQAEVLFHDDFAGSTLNTTDWTVLDNVDDGVTASAYLNGSGRLRIDIPGGGATFRYVGVMSNQTFAIPEGKRLVVDLLLPNSNAWSPTATSQVSMPLLAVSTVDTANDGRYPKVWTHHEVGFEGGNNWGNDSIFYNNEGQAATVNLGSKASYGATKHVILTIDADEVNWYLEDGAYQQGLTPIATIATADAFGAQQLQDGVHVYLLNANSVSNEGITYFEVYEDVSVSLLDVPEPAAVATLLVGTVLLAPRRVGR